MLATYGSTNAGSVCLFALLRQIRPVIYKSINVSIIEACKTLNGHGYFSMGTLYCVNSAPPLFLGQNLILKETGFFFATL